MVLKHLLKQQDDGLTYFRFVDFYSESESRQADWITECFQPVKGRVEFEKNTTGLTNVELLV